ncbi:hypothetical protein [Caulobacter segnis]
MTRGLLLLTAGLLFGSLAVLGGGAYAQTALQDRFMTEHALQDARRDLMATQTEIQNAQTRADTTVRLRGLDEQRAGPSLRPLTTDAAPRRDTDLSASTQQLERLTAQALAESNARMRAIRPASEPK